MDAGNVKVLDCFVSTFIRLSSNSFQNTVDIKFVTRLRMGLCHLPVYIFKHHFQDTLNLQCNCGMDVKSCTHFLLQSPFLINKRCALISNLIKVDTQRSKLTLPDTASNTVISSNFLVWKLVRKAQFPNRPKLWRNSAKKIGEISVFYAV